MNGFFEVFTEIRTSDDFPVTFQRQLSLNVLQTHWNEYTLFFLYKKVDVCIRSEMHSFIMKHIMNH